MLHHQVDLEERKKIAKKIRKSLGIVKIENATRSVKSMEETMIRRTRNVHVGKKAPVRQNRVHLPKNRHQLRKTKDRLGFKNHFVKLFYAD